MKIIQNKIETVKKEYKKYIRWFWILIVSPILILFLTVFLVALEFFGPLPTFEELENPKSNLATEVYSADQKLLGKYFIENRSNIHYKDLSPNIINALTATEDARFRDHSGIDGRGLLRVLFKTIILRQSNSGGGSTITQQLAKNLFPRENISGLKIVIRKIKEWIIAVKLEKNYTKDEIQAMYLNTVEFGSNAFGIKSASRTFFNTTPDSLKIPEASVLVGLLKAPTYYSPVKNPENSLKRRNVVLFQMQHYNYISKEEFDSIKVKPIELKYKAETHNEGLATYFREFLRDDFLKKWCAENVKPDGSPYNLYKDGLKIYTTINSTMQEYAEEAMKKHLGTELQRDFFKHWKGKKDAPFFQMNKGEIESLMNQAKKRSDRYATLKRAKYTEKEIDKNFNEKVKMRVFSWNGEIDTILTPMDSIRYYKHFLQAGFMSMEPQTGYIRAWVGGINYKHFKYDHVKMGRRQAGSTFKPFVYTVAMQEGYSPCYEVPNVRVSFTDYKGEVWSPENSDAEYGGMQSLKTALANSTNCVTAYLIKQFGPQSVINVARKMGITSNMEAVPSICLGTPDVSVYEMVGATSAFANKGVWTEPIFVNRIEDKNGNVIQEFVPKRVEAISEETAYLMLRLMQGVVEGGTGSRVRFRFKLTAPIAGKTGTTQNNSDGWFMGISKDLVSGVWVGCEDRGAHFRSTHLGQGANMALPIWGYYMQKIYADKKLNISQADFDRPSKAINVETNCEAFSQNPVNDLNFDEE